LKLRLAPQSQKSPLLLELWWFFNPLFFSFSWFKIELSNSRNAAVAPIPAKAIKTFNPHCSWGVTKLHPNTASCWGRWWRGCQGKCTKILITITTKLLILDHRVWSPARWRSTEKWGWWSHLPSRSLQKQSNWSDLLLDFTFLSINNNSNI